MGENITVNSRVSKTEKYMPTTTTSSKASFSVLETVMAPPSRVDRENGVIYRVKIIGLKSANGNEYPIEVLERCKDLYDGAAVFINHPEEESPELRELNDHFGTLHNITEEEDGLYGDLWYKKSHQLADPIAEAAEKKPLEFGLSHNAQVVTENGQPRGRVADIIRVRSVDLVSNPATTKGLFEEKKKMAKSPNPILEEEDPVPAPAASATEPDPAEAVRSTFKNKIIKILDDAGMSNEEKLEKISSLMDAADQAIEAVSDSMPDEVDAAEARDSGKLALEVRRLRIKDQARTLLESEGVPADPDLMDALANMTSTQAMKKLIKSWPKKATQRRTSQALEQVDRSPLPVSQPAAMTVKDFVNFARN